MLSKIFIFFFALFILPIQSHAQEISDHPLKLAELIDLALNNNPETRQAWWNAKRAAAVVGSAQVAYYPIIGLNGNISNGRDFKFINGPDVDYTITGVDLTLNMLLYDFGERDANVEAAKMALLSANWQTDWIIQNVLVHVFENTYSVLNLQETLAASLFTSKDALKMLDAAQQLNEAGLTPVTDVYTSQAQVSQALMENVQHQSDLNIAKAKLIASLGMQANTPIELTPIFDLPAPNKQQLMDLITIAMNQRADLMSKRARVAESRALQKKTKLSYQPKLSLSARGGANHAFNDKANAAQYQVQLNFDIPLFDGFERIYLNRAAYADTQTSLAELTKLELDISLEVFTYSQTVQATQEMLPLAEDNLNSTKKAYEGVLETYRAGKESIAVVSNALRQLAIARMRYSNVRTQLLVAAANLAFSTGTLSPYMEPSCKKSS